MIVSILVGRGVLGWYLRSFCCIRGYAFLTEIVRVSGKFSVEIYKWWVTFLVHATDNEPRVLDGRSDPGCCIKSVTAISMRVCCNTMFVNRSGDSGTA